MAHVVLRVARRAGLVALFVVAAVLGLVSGIVFAYAGDLPQIEALDDYTPNTITRVYAANGQVIGEFATERRVVVKYDDISPTLRQAIISAEDAGFDRHFGISISRIVITAAEDVIKRRLAGASTLTQQLARKLFLNDEKTWERKIKEALLAIQIERRYTKREILTLYCNQIYFGHGAYGVEAASRLYFDKRSKDLSLEEAAMIAGIIQTPERQSPYVDVRRATRRRNYVLQRMADEGYITQAVAAAAAAKPIETRGQPTQESVAPYFVEEVRKYLERQVRGQAALRERPVGLHVARRRPAGGRQPGARRRPARAGQAARVPEAAAQPARRGPFHRAVPRRSVEPPDGGRTGRARGRGAARRRAEDGSSSHRALRARNSAATRPRGPDAAPRRTSWQRAISSRCASRRSTRARGRCR